VSISEEIRASAGAHRDLGPAYDTAVAEGLVQRIGEEIDRRVDARLYGHLRQTPPEPPAPAARPARTAAPGRVGFWSVVLALGSMGMAIGATAVVLGPGPNNRVDPSAPLVALIWIAIAVVNVAYARRH
jgi:hypothetical protein